MAQLYAKTTSDGQPKAIFCTDDGILRVAPSGGGADIFLSDTMKTLAGAAQSITIPSGAKYFTVDSKGGDVNVRLNNTASATTGFYVPAGSARMIRLGGASSISVYGPTGAYAYFNFYG